MESSSDLCSVCKNGIVGDATSLPMADALQVLPQAEGPSEIHESVRLLSVELTPPPPMNGHRAADDAAAEEKGPKGGQASPLPRARRVTAHAVEIRTLAGSDVAEGAKGEADPVPDSRAKRPEIQYDETDSQIIDEMVKILDVDITKISIEGGGEITDQEESSSDDIVSLVFEVPVLEDQSGANFWPWVLVGAILVEVTGENKLQSVLEEAYAESTDEDDISASSMAVHGEHQNHWSDDCHSVSSSYRCFLAETLQHCVRNASNEDENSCIGIYNNENESKTRFDSLLWYPATQLTGHGDVSSLEAPEVNEKSKRPSDIDLGAPWPRKFRKLIGDISSCKYSTESCCGMDEILPDGFYDARRDRPFKSLEEYKKTLSLSSREVILLDRRQDEELDAIVHSARLLLSNYWRSSSGELDHYERASILAPFVSSCLGGSNRSSSVTTLRRSMVGSIRQEPFVCTCYAQNPLVELGEGSKFLKLTEDCMLSIKEALKSVIVPIGSVQFGICRHRSLLMKYLCDRADPMIQCELVRGYLDFSPHAWNIIPVRRGNSWIRMIVDVCNPSDIRDEMEKEYYCRYLPFSRVHNPLTDNSSPLFDCIYSTSFLSNEDVKAKSVFRWKFGTVDVAIKEVDIWSYGCLLYELLTLQDPHNGLSDEEVICRLRMRKGPSLPPDLEDLTLFEGAGVQLSGTDEALRQLIDLFSWCISEHPARRPTASDIYKRLCDISKQHTAALTESCDGGRG